jgi:hypothetical protein
MEKSQSSVDQLKQHIVLCQELIYQIENLEGRLSKSDDSKKL